MQAEVTGSLLWQLRRGKKVEGGLWYEKKKKFFSQVFVLQCIFTVLVKNKKNKK